MAYEKALAALRSGITTVILPRKNLNDLRDLPPDLKRRIRFIPVDHMNEVLEAALEQSPARRSASPRSPRGPATTPMASVKPR